MTDPELQPFRLALNDPTATVEQICQALRERREVGEALEWLYTQPSATLCSMLFSHWLSDGTAPSIIAALIRAHRESK